MFVFLILFTFEMIMKQFTNLSLDTNILLDFVGTFPSLDSLELAELSDIHVSHRTTGAFEDR